MAKVIKNRNYFTGKWEKTVPDERLKKAVSIGVSEEKLKEWDKVRNGLGLNRTDFFHRCIDHYITELAKGNV